MKNVAIKLVWATTLYVFGFAVLCQTEVSFKFLIGSMIFGFLLIPFMVYKVLSDNYASNKTFDQWYEDYPV
ncbi:hypothetical protein LZZ90_03875 [Flavobacterium sp. SM15]|uniref:hypothetical protein n=1 Tax=Flavobacterium sp. SM15 TaxID=2908005 RepID=UPI001EDA1111|nr:hypothetical protein [Flavobacterium sp. SM15]MCG2610641.1 hypothetical protein [Flavobacterium sp. SM15]